MTIEQTGSTGLPKNNSGSVSVLPYCWRLFNKYVQEKGYIPPKGENILVNQLPVYI